MIPDFVVKSELKKGICGLSERLENANYNNYNNVLKDLLDFIDTNNIIKEYVDSCGKPTLDLHVEFERLIPTISRHRSPLDFGKTEEEKVANIVNLLRVIVNNTNNEFNPVQEIMSCYSKSDNFQDKIDAINEQVFSILINRIRWCL